MGHWRGTWEPDKAYAPGDIVAVFESLSGSLSGETWEATDHVQPFARPSLASGWIGIQDQDAWSQEDATRDLVKTWWEMLPRGKDAARRRPRPAR